MKRSDIIAASDGDLIDPAQCTYISDIDGQACQADAGHTGGHTISGGPARGPVDADALLARVRDLRAIDETSGEEIPAPRSVQVSALADLLRKR